MSYYAAMAIKPISDDTGTLILFAAVTAAAVAFGAWNLRTGGNEPLSQPAD